MIKENVQSRLREMGANLSKERLAEWTDRLSSKLNDDATDEEVQTYLDGFEDVIKEQAKQDDRLRSLEAELKRKPEPNKPTEPKPEPVQDPNAELLRTLLEKVTNLETQKQAESLKSKFFNDERLKGIDKKFLERYVPRDVDSFDQEIKEATTLWNELKIAKYGNDTPPIGVGGVKQKTDKEIQETINRINKNK